MTSSQVRQPPGSNILLEATGPAWESNAPFSLRFVDTDCDESVEECPGSGTNVLLTQGDRGSGQKTRSISHGSFDLVTPLSSPMLISQLRAVL
ncbi:hypothetical protein GDO81_015461 [Engystomops pustulosus]|uniref:Uncharacterized protein n=1 Tax=Engystomops pustulosus TaxID=76066 RepID=A0AAV7AQT1_ENGPU|nr:hypothetical protein GDO81_015461 [Engystomops pustulosus]